MPETTPRVCAAALMLALALAVTSCDGQPLATTEIRYELRVEMTVDGRPVTASTVHGLRVSENMTFGLGAPALLVRAEGQAIVHYMGAGRGWLIVPLVGETQGNLDSMFVSSCVGSRGDRTGRQYVEEVAAFSGECQVREQWRPLLVMASDKNDKASLKVVDAEQMDKSFGAGIELRRIVLETTDDPVSTGVLSVLPWLKKRTAENFEYVWIRGPRDRSLTDGNFATELKQ